MRNKRKTMPRPSDNETVQLRRQLNAYIKQAQENEQKLNRLQNYELKLISTSSLQELFQVLLCDYKSTAQLTQVTLELFDSDYEIRRLLTELGLDARDYPGLRFLDDEQELPADFQSDEEIWLGTFNQDLHGRFLSEPNNIDGSVAFLPLIRNQVRLGALIFVSDDKARYTELTGTDFLVRLASFVSVCLENAINNEKVKRLGLIDPLTGVYNRRYFERRLEEEIRRTARADTPLACLFLDIDHFKQINDNFGHGIGDSILQGVAATIREQLRASDVLARIGGEEFVALLVQTEHQRALEIAERVRFSVAEKIFNGAGGENITATISIGCSSLRQFADTDDAAQVAHALLDEADQALYSAKRAGRNRVLS